MTLAKEPGRAIKLVVTSGVFIACFCLIALALRLVYVSGIYALPVSAFLILITLAALYKGWRWRYILARTIYGGLAILIVGGTINPPCYDEADIAGISYSSILWEFLPLAGLAVFLFWCLGVHAKWRGLNRGEK